MPIDTDVLIQRLLVRKQKAQALTLRLGLALPLVSLSLCGCETRESAATDLDKTLHPVAIGQGIHGPTMPITVKGLATAPGIVQPKLGLPGDEADNGGTATGRVGQINNDRTMHYYTTISDVYWKLNWMRKRLREGAVPYNMLDEIDKARPKLETIQHDGNYDLALEALDRFQKGLEHLACLRILRAARIDDRRVPWETDRTTLKQYLEQQGSGGDKEASYRPIMRRATGGGDEIGAENDDGSQPRYDRYNLSEPASRPELVQAEAIVLDYQAQYHAAPRELMQREWETAIRKTNRLRDNLGLQNRQPNKDGDATDVLTAVTLAADAPDLIHVPRDAGKASTAPAPVKPRS